MTTPYIYPNFLSAIRMVQLYLRQNGTHLQTESWQGMKTPPEFYEALNVSFSVYIPHWAQWVEEIKPNIPWANDHFAERVGGQPLNPGEQYKNWPMYKNNPGNDTSRVNNGQFSHTYMERFWPKQAGGDFECGTEYNSGIRFELADLNTLMENMKKEPFTRQAYLPIWFPEDGEAVAMGQRVPCTLGYHFMRRGKVIHMVYYIRSCDFLRHFRDDIYLALRLVRYILLTLQANDHEKWHDVSLGTFTMHITSLHIFSKEYNLIKDL